MSGMVVPMKRLILTMGLLLVGSAAFMLMRGQPSYGQTEDPADAPEHGVARVSLAEGSVRIMRGDGADLSDSALNAPLVTADRITTGEGSRAEVQFDSANFIRLAANTEVRMG